MGLTCGSTLHGWRARIVGLDQVVPLADGRLVPAINLDNAASTPPLRDVADAVARFLPFYSSVHRGAGYKSRVSTALYDQARESMARFVGAGPRSNTVIFGKNTTEAINKLAFRYPLTTDSIVISTEMEHHSNDLPWRRTNVVRARVTPDGRLDEDHLDQLLAAYRGRVALVAVSGASNVTGFVQPIHRLARKAHRAGARILVDAAQLAPHRRIDIGPDDDPEHIDFVALSAHKMYAPFGTGALVGPRAIFERGVPEYQGGGTVDVVTPDRIEWAGAPDRDEAGTPNVVGAVAMAVAAHALMDAGMDRLARHEAALTAYALRSLRLVPGITIYGERDPGRTADRVGVIAFNLESKHHALVAAILSDEAGIAVRSGCFCAQPYVASLLGMVKDRPGAEVGGAAGHRRRPGMVRASLGAYNTTDDIDALVAMLRRIVAGDYQGNYHPDRAGELRAAGVSDQVPGLSWLWSGRSEAACPALQAPPAAMVPVRPRASWSSVSSTNAPLSTPPTRDLPSR